MSSSPACKVKRQGNIWQEQLPPTGPYEGSVEKVCEEPGKYMKSSSYVYTTEKPNDPRELQKTVEEPKGFWSFITDMFGSPEADTPKIEQQDESSQGPQPHTLPTIEDVPPMTLSKRGGGGTVKRAKSVKRQAKKSKKRSMKKQKSKKKH